MLPSLDGGLRTEKVEPLTSDYTRSKRPVWILEGDNERRVRARGVGGGGTNPRGELSDGKAPKSGVVEGECSLALRGWINLRSFANAGRDPIDK